MANVLIDTSAWIEFFRPVGLVPIRTIIVQLLDDNAAALCGIVLVELLKGARSDREYRALEERLDALLYLETPEKLWRRVGQFASFLLRKGIQVPTTDLVIATVAIENNVAVLQCGKHFRLLAKHLPLTLIAVPQ